MTESLLGASSPKSRLSLRQVRYFLTVAELGNFTQAAQQLFVAQPALSRQIAQMEQTLGYALFARSPRGVALTAAGEVFRQRLLPLEQQLLAAEEEAGQVARGAAGGLRLLHSSSVPAASLRPWLVAFLQAAPGARIELDRLSSEAQISEVAAARADVGVARMPVLNRDPAVCFWDLPEEKLWAVLPAGHPLGAASAVQLADLADEPFVSAMHRERGGLARRVTELCIQRGFVPRLAPVISRKTAQLELVAAGFGVTVVPERMVSLCRENVIARPLADAEATSHLALVFSQQPAPLVARFIDLVQKLTPS
ncbi:MAG: LysR family transcriptional regulator [Zoogloea sp.]|uniref:LysR family transcriptional regulator n=1 Tax=Zoogloea sp. TaxID=49181 RepID=UPI003F39BA12